ncbi:MAG TPA: cytochrome c biogenesis protein ResB [Thermomicrobiales bacterium]|nr:cytochrome c biogenesis protein ResB [Thermomicrobiales bacterium]
MADATINSTRHRSPVETAIDRVWRFFCSVRAAIGEISFLALLVLIGTLRGSEVPQWIADGIPALQPFVDRWYAWDVFRSPVFAATLALIAIAIAVCTINRVPGIWQTISEPRVRTSIGYLTRADTSATFRPAVPAGETASAFTGALARRKYRVLTEEVGQDTHIYADRNRYGKLGTFPFHLALILLMVGGIVAATYGFREREFVIPVGETRAVGHGTGMSVELVQFSDTYTPLGIAEDYRAEIVIYDDGEPVKHTTISPNDPTSWRTATFYQSSFGYGARMLVLDQSGTELFSGTIDTGIFTYAGNPDAPAGFVEIPPAGVTLTVVAPDIDPANAPELDSLNLRNGQMLLMIQPIGGGTAQRETIVVNQGQPVQIGNLTIEFEREVQWTLLQVAYNPGIPIFIIASVLLLGGLLSTFYFPLRRIRAIVTPTPAGSMLVAVPLAKRDWSGKRDFFRTVAAVESDLNARPELKQPTAAEDWEPLPAANMTDT